MKEKSYIITKLLKKQAPLIIFAVLMVLFLINFINRPDVYASEQIANVTCDVCVINGDKVKQISSDNQAISNLESSEINFSDVNVKLGAKSKLEFTYVIKNVRAEDCSFSLILNKNIIENFKIEYYVDNTFNGDLIQFDHVLTSLEKVEIKVVVYVDKVACDACLNGSLEIMFECVGEING